jgi:hypothetical protein
VLEHREEIVRRWLAGESYRRLGDAFGVSRTRIEHIIHIDATRDRKRDRERAKIDAGGGSPKKCGACGELGHNRRRHAS